ncbi:hypothetical protein [Natronosalvus rutilus]|nr:hypothetical protein [Natronosalvus rutilus]
MSDRPKIKIQRQTAFGDDGQLEVTETSVGASTAPDPDRLQFS